MTDRTDPSTEVSGVPPTPTLKDVLLGRSPMPSTTNLRAAIELVAQSADEMKRLESDNYDLSGVVDDSPQVTAKSVQSLVAHARTQADLSVQMEKWLEGLYDEAKGAGKLMRWTLVIALATLLVSGAGLWVAIALAQR
jgi:hypothetical protein